MLGCNFEGKTALNNEFELENVIYHCFVLIFEVSQIFLSISSIFFAKLLKFERIF